MVAVAIATLFRVDARTPTTTSAVLVSNADHKSYEFTFQYDCCSSRMVHTVYHPGGLVTIKWIRQPDSSPPKEVMVISAWIVGPYSTSNILE